MWVSDDHKVGLGPTALDICRDSIIALAEDDKVIYCNLPATKLFGYSRADIEGTPISSIIPGFSRDLEAATDSRPTPTSVCFMSEAVTAVGEHFDAELHLSQSAEHGKAASIRWITVANATIRKRRHEQQKLLIDCARLVGREFIDETVAVLANALDARWVMLCEIDHEPTRMAHTIAYWADGECRANFSYELQGTPCGDVIEDRVCVHSSGIQRLFPDDAVLVEMGAESYIGAPLHASNGQLLGLLAVLHDKPLQETSEAALTVELFAGRAGAELERLKFGSSAERLGRIVEDAASEVFVFDAETFRFLLVNKGARDNLGYTMDELSELTPIDIKPEFTIERFLELVEPLLSGSQNVISFDTVHRRKDGSDYNVTVRLQLFNDQERPVFFAAIEDTTEQSLILRELRDTTERLNTVLANTTMAVFLMNDRQECIYMNEAAETLTGYRFAETEGRRLHDVIHHTYPDGRPFPIDECAIDRALPSGNNEQGEDIFIHKNGSFYPVSYSASPIRDASGAPVGTVIEARNITVEIEAKRARENFNAELEARIDQALAERDAAEAKLRHAQKMEAIGKLTGGVAHDFNNLLQVVGGNLELLARDVSNNPRAAQRVDMALSATERGARLAHQLLAFGRKQPLNPRPCNIPVLMTNIEDMLRRLLGEHIELQFSSMSEIWECMIDHSQLENAVLNLAINARDAMPEGGRLTIQLENVVIEEGSWSDLVAGEYAAIKISDTGCGMTSDIRERVFEPFFTTKEVGKGSGLGLSMVYGLMKQSGGHVSIESEEGVGTTVTLYLPRTIESLSQKCDPTGEDVPSGNETILVVEDDDEVRITVSSTLRELGYHVLLARDAEAGLAVLESGTRIDLLFTDVIMPGKVRSHDLARRAVEILPEISVLFTSGYTENGIIHDGRLDAGVDLLSKPYNRAVLAQRIRQSLDARKPVKAKSTENEVGTHS
jgi:PAS domain S-box-containing protein